MTDLVSAAAVVVAAGTYISTSGREKALHRAELVHTYSSEFSHDAELVDVFTDIDYERYEFTEDETTWLGQAPEKRLVRMLDLFNSLGHNWFRKIISLEDIHGTTLGYAILRAYNDPNVSSYLKFVDGHDADHLGTGAAFEYFRRLVVALDKRSVAMRAKKLEWLASRKLGGAAHSSSPANAARSDQS